MNLIEYPDRDMLAINLANVLAGELKATLLSHDTASIAVPGGTTPGPVFDALCAAPLEWDKVMVVPTDERWVAPDDPRSNARLIREHLLVGRAAEARFLSLHGKGARPEDDLDRIAAQIEPALPLSVLLLGMGADCHVASLFPDAPGLAAALADDAPPLAAMAPADQPEARITLTAPVLDGALKKHLVILGPDKREALERAQSLSPQEAPVQAVLSEMNVHWAE